MRPIVLLPMVKSDQSGRKYVSRRAWSTLPRTLPSGAILRAEILVRLRFGVSD